MATPPVYKQYLEIIRFAINCHIEPIPNLYGMDWRGFYQFSQEQAIVGVVFEGINSLGNQGVKPPLGILMKWIAITELLTGQNRKQIELQRKLFGCLDENGYKACLLKGLGVASYYPNPLYRQNGDFDVWVDAERTEVIRMVREFVPNAEVSLHHIDFKNIGGVPVEIHFMPSYLINPFKDRLLQRWFKKQKDAQFVHYSKFYQQDEGTTCVPTVEFNMVFLLTHMYRHFLYEGLGLRHIIDYYYLLMSEERKHMDDKQISEIRKIISSLGLMKFTKALMWVLHDVLGIDESLLLFESDEREGRFLLEKVLDSGNFGRRNNMSGWINRKKWLAKMFWHYPSDVLWGIPHSIIYRMRTCHL